LDIWLCKILKVYVEKNKLTDNTGWIQYFFDFFNQSDKWNNSEQENFIDKLCRIATDLHNHVYIKNSSETTKGLHPLSLYDIWKEYIYSPIGFKSETFVSFEHIRDLGSFLRARQLFWNLKYTMIDTHKYFEIFNSKMTDKALGLISFIPVYVIDRTNLCVNIISFLCRKFGISEQPEITDITLGSFTTHNIYVAQPSFNIHLAMSVISKIPTNLLMAFGRCLIPYIFNVTEITFKTSEVVEILQAISISVAIAVWSNSHYYPNSKIRWMTSAPLILYSGYSLSKILANLWLDFNEDGLIFVVIQAVFQKISNVSKKFS
jgi:hypothetical protein